MKLQLFVAQLPVLFQYGTPQNLLGSHTLSAGVIPAGLRDVLKNKVQQSGILVEYPGHLLQLHGNLAVGFDAEQLHLIVEFPPHFYTPANQFDVLLQDVIY
jgi:hypothetical protein